MSPNHAGVLQEESSCGGSFYTISDPRLLSLGSDPRTQLRPITKPLKIPDIAHIFEKIITKIPQLAMPLLLASALNSMLTFIFNEFKKLIMYPDGA